MLGSEQAMSAGPEVAEHLQAADPRWLSLVSGWFRAKQEQLFAITPPGGASTSYFLFKSAQDLTGLVRTLRDGTRIVAYKRHSLTIRGVVDDGFREKALRVIPDNVGYLVVRLDESAYSSGLEGHAGRSHQELKEHLYQCRGEFVRIGPNPDDTSDHVSIAYKGGIVGS